MSQNIFERFVDQHDQALEQLSYFEAWLGLLPHERGQERQSTMRRIVQYLDQHVLVDAQWEERQIFPRLAGAFTEMLRHEHRLIQERTQALAAMAENPDADIGEMQQEGWKLLGLLEAHFQTEERTVFRHQGQPDAVEGHAVA